jgi:hypothetical protein
MGLTTRAQQPDRLPVKETLSEISLFLVENSGKNMGKLTG